MAAIEPKTHVLALGALTPAEVQSLIKLSVSTVFYRVYRSAQKAKAKPSSWAAAATAGQGRSPAPITAQQTPASVSKRFIGIRGISNEGNTCFMNAPLQMLISLEALTSTVLTREPTPSELLRGQPQPMCSAFRALLWKFQDTDDIFKSKDSLANICRAADVVSASPVYQQVLKHPEFGRARNEQHDAEELITFLLSTMHAELADAKDQSPASPSTAAASSSSQNEDEWFEAGANNRSVAVASVGFDDEIGSSPIAQALRGVHRSSLHIKGQPPRVTLQPFYVMPLEVQAENISTLEEALAQSCQAEQLDDVAHAGVKGMASKQMSFEALPQVLLIQLKRVYYTPQGAVKINKHVSFPDTLTVSDKWLSATAVRRYKGLEYKLHAVIYHVGEHQGKGHYMCGLKTPKGWIEISDSRVLASSKDEIFGARTTGEGQAYMLCYERVKAIDGDDAQ